MGCHTKKGGRLYAGGPSSHVYRDLHHAQYYPDPEPVWPLDEEHSGELHDGKARMAPLSRLPLYGIYEDHAWDSGAIFGFFNRSTVQQRNPPNGSVFLSTSVTLYIWRAFISSRLYQP